MYTKEKSCELAKAKERVYRLCANRIHSQKELFEKLSKDYFPETVAAAVEYATQIGLVDDAQYAQMKSSALLRRKKSLRETQQHLFSKGISSEQIKLLLPQDEDTDFENIMLLLNRQYKSKIDSGKTENVVAALVRRGFKMSDIKRALEIIGQEEIFEGGFE